MKQTKNVGEVLLNTGVHFMGELKRIEVFSQDEQT
jgi:hypothetical protein